jgi:hypothetical protein
MAKINFGSVVNDARGKINGTVYSKNKSGPYIRMKVTGVNPRSERQTVVRSVFASTAQAWSGLLTAAQRAAWTAFANTYPITNIFGLAIVLNGMNWFVKCNQVLNQISGGIALLPPASPLVQQIPFDLSSVTATTTSLVFNQTAADPEGVGTSWYIFATPGLPPGRNPKLSDYRYIAAPAAATTGFPAPISIYAEYVACYGPIIPGTVITLAIMVVDVEYGITTVPIRVPAVVT